MEFADLEAERSLLSAILLDDNQARGSFALASLYVRTRADTRDDGAVIVSGDFADQRHNEIFSAMAEVIRSHMHLDAVSLGQVLKARDRWNSCGGAYLAEIIDATYTTAHVETHARIVRREADRRRALETLNATRAKLRSVEDPDVALTEALETMRGHVAGVSRRGGPQHIFDACVRVAHHIEEARQGRAPRPLSLALPSLDRITGGMFPGQVVVVAGVQGRGKTSWLKQVIEATGATFNEEARREGRAPHRIAWWSLEMPSDEIVWRHAGLWAKLPQDRLRTGHMSDTDLDTVHASFNALSSLPIDIDGESGPNVLDIRSYLFAHPEVKLAAIDWLCCLQPHPSLPRGSKQHERAAMDMEVLAQTARQLGITIIVPNQFTQEANRGKEQTMHDMIGGAAVVNFASIILVMRPGDAMTGDDLPVKIRVEKSRMSGNAEVDAVFKRGAGKFVETGTAQNVAPEPEPVGDYGDLPPFDEDV